MNLNETGRFVSDGKGLNHWLWELVCDDMDRRSGAAKVIIRMWEGGLLDPGFDFERHLEEFGASVRQAVDAAGSDAAEFIEKLIDTMEAAHREGMRLWKEGQARVDRVTDRLLARLGPDPKPEDMAAIMPRLRRVAGSACDPKNANERAQQELSEQQIAAQFVFSALREQLLLKTGRVRALLRSENRWHSAAEALERIGPAANLFAGELLAQLDRSGGRRYDFRMPKALAAVIRDDPARIREVVRRLEANEPGVSAGAAQTLWYLGERAARLTPECVARLLAMTRREEVRGDAIQALGQVTRGTDVAVDRLLALSHDRDHWVKGAALTALGEIGRQPEKIVPRLIAAFDDYQEQDSDYQQSSEHERVVRALQAFGAAAAPAVPALIARVRRPGRELDWGVIETLGKLGAAARDALPVLEQIADTFGYTTDDLQNDTDFLAQAISRLRASVRP